MNSTFFLRISDAVSTNRLNAYRQSGDDEVTTLGRYFWNMATCESFYSPLQMVEVALRNAIHRVLTAHFGTDAWYNRSRALVRFQDELLVEVEEALKKAGQPLAPARIVSQLSFGFWTGFFNKSHNTTGIGPCVLKHVFGRCLKSQRRQQFQEARWGSIRMLRNRIFHHEKIILWPDLPQRHEDLLQTIGWISPELEEVSRKLDRFVEIHSNGVAPWVERIRNHWPRRSQH